MKHVITLLIVFSISAFAQSSLPKASENYLHALKSDNIGVLESAVFNIVKLKLQFPQQDTDKLLAALKELSQNAGDESLRYRAYLAASFLQQDDLRSRIKVKNHEDAEAFFVLLANTLEDELLVSK
ncbi:MAG: hypothetical protein ACRBF0_24025 [Calditrichia bacterium]